MRFPHSQPPPRAPDRLPQHHAAAGEVDVSSGHTPRPQLGTTTWPEGSSDGITPRDALGGDQSYDDASSSMMDERRHSAPEGTPGAGLELSSGCTPRPNLGHIIDYPGTSCTEDVTPRGSMEEERGGRGTPETEHSSGHTPRFGVESREQALSIIKEHGDGQRSRRSSYSGGSASCTGTQEQEERERTGGWGAQHSNK